MDEDDDFGGFEAADPDSDPVSLTADESLPSHAAGNAVSSPDVSSIPWLAASIQATTEPASANTVSGKTTLPARTKETTTFSPFAELSTSSGIDWSKVSNPEIPTPVPASSSDVQTSTVVQDLKSQLEVALEDKQKHRADTIGLKLKNEEYSKDLMRLQTELSEQRDRYKEVQAKHSADLQEIKEANHKALSIIVEEYKESVKLSAVEQQKSYVQIFTDLMDKEAAKFKTVFEEQANSYGKWKEEFTEDINKKYKDSVTELKQDVEEEKQRLKVTYDAELELAKEKLLLLKSEALQDVQRDLGNKMAELEIKCKEVLNQSSEELRDVINSQCKQASDNERTISMDFWEKHSSEMMKKLQENLDSNIQSQRESMDSYISERVQRDQSSHRKHLSAINVYLEAASKHITAITDDNTALS